MIRQLSTSFGAEVIVFSTTYAIERVAERIERAYLRQHAGRVGGAPDARVWTRAAVTLMQLHRSEPALPLDPELFVLAQPSGPSSGDPWADLTGPTSIDHYRRRVRRIVRQLRAELRAEIRRAALRLERGERPEAVLTGRSRTLSPLARFIAAHRAGRPDLAERLRARATEQHWACPLYLQACRGLLPRSEYPVSAEAAAAPEPSARRGPSGPLFSLN